MKALDIDAKDTEIGGGGLQAEGITTKDNKHKCRQSCRNSEAMKQLEEMKYTGWNWSSSIIVDGCRLKPGYLDIQKYITPG